MARSFISIADLTATELKTLIANGIKIKKAIQSGNYKNASPLQGQTVSLIFSKRSTRTRISTEGAVAYLGGQPMFLGKDDIQLGVNESLYDTTRVVSSMTSAIVARVGPHSDILALAKDSRVPVINALCEKFHPMQAVADMIAIQEAFGTFSGLKVAWVGDANNVLHDLALASVKLGMNISIATPSTRPVSDEIKKLIDNNAEGAAAAQYTSDPLEAVKDANIIVTDTWISMGQEAETQEKLKEFAGYQITMDMAKKGGAAANWKFMHCLPRHKEEVDDEVFYSDRSIVFEEAENRLYSAIAVLDAFVVNKGTIE